ncbi:MAG: MBL fold metallo-hydrolase [Candidatus Zambryskibacteria bacterium]|nr:MBL fold metallo-hydrolase [Candidatus Zambryskibacteria bacterium]
MMKYHKLLRQRWRESILTALLVGNICVWTAFWQETPTNLLKVYFLDIGQGDSVFIETPTHKQLLLDGGPNKKVLAELGKILPFGDKTIDVMIESHPDKDHIGGLPEVVSRYDVGLFIEPGVESENSIDDELHARLEAKNIPQIVARSGMVINFGDGVKLEILFPNQDVSRWETNDASIVAKLEYGEKSFLLTGDSPIKVENTMIYLNKQILDADVLKVGHHGSRTSTSLSFAEAVSPDYAVISAGKDNTYGHPHKEVLDILSQVGAQVVSTLGKGIIKFETDGKNLKLK